MPLAAHGATLLLGVVRQAYDVDSDRNGLSLVTIYISVISVLAWARPLRSPCDSPCARRPGPHPPAAPPPTGGGCAQAAPRRALGFAQSYVLMIYSVELGLVVIVARGDEYMYYRILSWLHTTPAMLFLIGVLSKFPPKKFAVVIARNSAMLLVGLSAHFTQRAAVSAALLCAACYLFTGIVNDIHTMFCLIEDIHTKARALSRPQKPEAKPLYFGSNQLRLYADGEPRHSPAHPELPLLLDFHMGVFPDRRDNSALRTRVNLCGGGGV